MRSQPVQKPGRSKQDYGTPLEFLFAVKKRLGIEDFAMDLAASAENRVTHRFYANDQFGNALTESWPTDGWNWLNPPFTKIGPWVEKAERLAWNNATRTAMLIPAAVGSNWWRDYVHNRCLALFLNPRLTFVGCDAPYPKDCALLLYCHGFRGYDVWRWK